MIGLTGSPKGPVNETVGDGYILQLGKKNSKAGFLGGGLTGPWCYDGVLWVEIRRVGKSGFCIWPMASDFGYLNPSGVLDPSMGQLSLPTI